MSGPGGPRSQSNRLLYLLPLLTLVIMAGFFGWSLLSGRDPASIGSVMVNRPAPPLSAPPLREGEPALTSDLLKTGKPVLLNFFASWCTPCLAEHPLLLRLKEREGVTIVGIAWKNKPEEARAWLKRLGDPFTDVGTDYEGKLSLDWGLSGVPETYLIDASGIVRLHYHAPITERDLKDTILPLLKAGK
jgi:cytochrome c biogenesis protein CcmG/thiol:disulfide interchange protein DsbE